ncbi:hypothetical protein OXPF_39420 [Oxobacter pfennigii]|uniref:Uncharacterized protein n=1 Tax=Oxobacter pfennigii TaxID=36849 RepID=A0A0P9AAV9_9CLOT|nr:hypothetical protein [Oxobacter pfennigii]KPU42163.1 hypothetical protein OXPF_39420 [Oxobacter pfennigii]
MNLKDIIENDVQNLFFNLNEFAELHNINNRELVVVVDNDQLIKRSKKEYDGISVGEILYFVRAADYGNPPKVDEIQIFDNQSMLVFDVRISDGVYEIILKRNE